MTPQYLFVSIAVIAAATSAFAQENASGEVAPADNNNVAHPLENKQPKHVFGIIPNFRTSEMLHPYTPITAKEKFRIAAQDSFDRGTLILAAVFAGSDQITDSEKSYGQGVEGYSKYFGAEYTTFVVGNYMTEAIFPTVLHQDPRYFRLGCCGWKRLGYAMGQIFWTHTDRGTGQINYSELGGNAVAVGISEAYYPDDRNAGEFLTSWGTQIGVDMAVNVLKEFWPDVDRKFSHKHREADIR